MATRNFLDKDGLLYLWQQLKAKLAGKVDVVEGKGLSTNDYTNADKEKLGGIAAGAQVNVIEKVSVNGTEQAITDKGVNVVVPTKHSDLGEVAESDLTAELAEKVNAAAEGNHAHANKDLLDTYTQTEADLADAVAKKHAHANAAELDKIAEGDKAKWDAAAADTATIKADYLKQADKYDDTALKGRVTEVEGKVTTLIGEDANKSVRTIANEELAAQLIGENAKESLDTLEEIAAWIQSHPDDASAMNSAIVALQNKVDTGDKTVSAYVTDAINALSIGDYAKASELTALAARVKAIEDDYVKASELVAMTTDDIDSILAQ